MKAVEQLTLILSFEKLTEILIFRANGKATLSQYFTGVDIQGCRKGYILAEIFMQLQPFALAEKLSSSDGKIKKKTKKKYAWLIFSI